MVFVRIYYDNLTTNQRPNKSLPTTSVTFAYQLKEASFTQPTVLFSNSDYTLQFVWFCLNLQRLARFLDSVYLLSGN